MSQNIPSLISFGKNKNYEVFLTKKFHKDGWFQTTKKIPQCVGQTRFNPSVLLIQDVENPKYKMEIFFHEYLHALDEAKKIGLTEAQVLKLDKCFEEFYTLMKEFK